MARPCVIAVGGLDPTAGAGIVADALVLAMHGVGVRAVAAVITAQGGAGPVDSRPVDAALVARSLSRAAGDAAVAAVKTGALGTAAQVEAVARFLDGLGPVPLIVDPVMAASAGGILLDGAGIDALRALLVPLAAVVTPNIAEAAALSAGRCEGRAGMEEAARSILRLGPRWVLVKGGHLDGDPADLLAGCGGERIWLEGRRIAAVATHGTGCVLASSVAAWIARGLDPVESVRRARRFVEEALLAAAPGGPAPDLIGLVCRRAADPVEGDDS